MENEVTVHDLVAKIRFFDGGSHQIISPADLENKELWDDDACRIILTELLYQAYDHKELLDIFSSRMGSLQRERAQQVAAQYGVDPNLIIQQEEFTRYNPADAESFLYASLSRLKSVNLVKTVAHTTILNKMYYSLTDEGRKLVLKYLSAEFKDDFVVFIKLIKYYNERTSGGALQVLPEQVPVPIMHLFMAWIESNFSDIDQLIALFTSSVPLSNAISVYRDYLMTMEGESPAELSKKESRIKIEVFQKMQSLVERGLAISNPHNDVYELTQNGMETFGRLYTAFQNLIGKMQNYHLVDVNADENFIFGEIALTRIGHLIGDQIKSEISRDEYLIMNLTDDYDYHDEYLIPIADEIVRLKKLQKNAKKIPLVIPKRNRKGFKYRLLNVITHEALITIFFVASIFSLVMTAQYGVDNRALLGSTILLPLISATLYAIRRRYFFYDINLSNIMERNRELFQIFGKRK